MPLWKRTLSLIFKTWTAVMVIGSSLPTAVGAKVKEEDKYNNQTQSLAKLYDIPPMQECSVPFLEGSSFPTALTIYDDCTISGNEPVALPLIAQECVLSTNLKDIEEAEISPEAFAATANNLMSIFKQVHYRIRATFHEQDVFNDLSFKGLPDSIQRQLINNILKKQHFDIAIEQLIDPQWSYEREEQGFHKAVNRIKKMIVAKEKLTPTLIHSLIEMIKGSPITYRIYATMGLVPAAFAPATVIKEAIEGLCHYLQDESLFDRGMNPLDIIIRAFFVQSYILSLHPYSDGNGRLALIICNYLLMAGDLPPIPSRFSHSSMDSLVQVTSFLKEGHLDNISAVLMGRADLFTLLDDTLPKEKQIKYIKETWACHTSPYSIEQILEKRKQLRFFFQPQVLKEQNASSPNINLPLYKQLLRKQQECQIKLIIDYITEALEYYRNISSENTVTLGAGYASH